MTAAKGLVRVSSAISAREPAGRYAILILKRNDKLQKARIFGERRFSSSSGE
jgi:hypothetical protein